MVRISRMTMRVLTYMMMMMVLEEYKGANKKLYKSGRNERKVCGERVSEQMGEMSDRCDGSDGVEVITKQRKRSLGGCVCVCNRVRVHCLPARPASQCKIHAAAEHQPPVDAGGGESKTLLGGTIISWISIGSDQHRL